MLCLLTAQARHSQRQTEKLYQFALAKSIFRRCFNLHPYVKFTTASDGYIYLTMLQSPKALTRRTLWPSMTVTLLVKIKVKVWTIAIAPLT